MSLQEAIAAWHLQRFPTASIAEVGLKAASEVGEVCDSINDLLDGRPNDVPYEVADACLVLLVLMGRWFPERDLLAEVEDRLARFMDPNGGHRSCVQP